MSKIPLKLARAIRDYTLLSGIELSERLAPPKDEVGLAPELIFDWALLWIELDEVYGHDEQAFVWGMHAAVDAWREAFYSLLANDLWADKMVDALDGHFRVFLEAGFEKEPTTAWSSLRGGFELFAPRTAQWTAEQLKEAYVVGLSTAFLRGTGQGGTGESAALAPVQPKALAVGDGRPELLPNVRGLPAPDQLQQRAPYHLIVTAGSVVEVLGSHSPTLELMAEYLQRWCVADRHRVNNPPVLNIKLHAAAFGPRQLHDRLTIEIPTTHSIYTLTTPLVLRLAEQLGYKCTSTDGVRWAYRRDEEIRAT